MIALTGSIHLTLALLCALLIPLPGHARARLEPLLAEAVRGDLTSARRAYPRSVLPDGRLRLLVRLKDGAPPSVALAGFEHEAPAGPVVPVRVAPDRLHELARRPAVLLVEACRALRPLLDRSVPETGAIVARQQLGLDGSGVLVGIVDSGIDFRHQDFLDSRGRTRLRYVLDFSLAPDGTGADSHGARLYTAPQIEQQLALDRAMGARAPQLVLHRDVYGHGTHVAGIAAGTGADASPPYPRFRYVGVAPGASLIAVKATRDDGDLFTDADVLHGVQFVFERAAALKMPAVVNISLGTQLGPHDGTSNLATAISALTGEPGRIVVSAAGNDGGRDLHAAGFLAIDGPGEVVLQIYPYLPGPGRDLVHLEVWYPQGGLDLELTTPGGRTVGPVPTGGRLEELTPDGLVKLLNAPEGVYLPNARFKAVVIVDERDEISPKSGNWTLHLRGQTPRYDVWLVNPGRGARLLGPLDPDTRLSSPGTATGVISVGAYSLRESWPSVEGPMVDISVRPLEHAIFSGTGPTLDGRFLPDISAPGELIISALSRHASPLSPSSVFHNTDLPGALWHVDRTRGLLRGTSQAAPHVAGALALLLQRSPDLTLDQARELLRVGGRVDEHVGTGRAWSPRWGFGKLDVATSLAVLDGKKPGALDPRASGVAVNRDLVPPGSTDRVTVTVIPRDSSGLPLGPGREVEVTASTGRLGQTNHVAFGRYEARFFAQGAVGETAQIRVTVDGVELERRPLVHLVSRRDRIGVAPGGCAIVLGGPSSWPSWLLLLLGWLYLQSGEANGRSRRPRRSRARPISRPSPSSAPREPPAWPS